MNGEYNTNNPPTMIVINENDSDINSVEMNPTTIMYDPHRINKRVFITMLLVLYLN